MTRRVSINGGSRKQRITVACGLEWARRDPPEKGDGKDVASRFAAAQGAPYFAWQRGADRVMVGYPSNTTRLNGKELSAAILLAKGVGDGIVVCELPLNTRPVWVLVVAGGYVVDGGERLFDQSDIATAFEFVQRTKHDLEDALNTILPVHIDSSLESAAQGVAGFAGQITRFNFIDAMLASTARTPARLHASKGQTAQGGKVFLMVAVLAALAGMVVYTFAPDLTRQAEVVDKGPTPEEIYVTDLQGAWAGIQHERASNLKAMFTAVQSLPLKREGWTALNIECQAGSCGLQWNRELGGMPPAMKDGSIQPLQSARTRVSYTPQPGDIGLKGSEKLPTDIRLLPEVKESVVIDKVYPVLMQFSDLKARVSVQQAAPLVANSVAGAPNIMVMGYSVKDSVRGDKVPQLIEALSALPSNVTVERLKFVINKTADADQIEIAGRVVFVKGI